MNEEEKVTSATPESISGEYLGRRKIKSFTVDGDMHNIEFEDGTKALLHKTLYGILISAQPFEEDLTDLVYSTVAKILFKQIVEFGLTSGQVEPVCAYIHNMGANSYNQATKKLWGGKDVNSVPLKEIMIVLDSKTTI